MLIKPIRRSTMFLHILYTCNFVTFLLIKLLISTMWKDKGIIHESDAVKCHKASDMPHSSQSAGKS